MWIVAITLLKLSQLSISSILSFAVVLWQLPSLQYQQKEAKTSHVTLVALFIFEAHFAMGAMCRLLT